MRLRWLHLLLLCSLWAASWVGQPAAAATPDDSKAKYATAQRLYKEGRFDQALPLFQQVTEELDSPNARFYVARSLRELGRLGEAYDQMHRTVRDAAARAATEQRFVQTRDAATKELAELRKRLAFVVVTSDQAPPGAELQVAGRVLAPAQLGKEFAVTPGKVVVTGSAAAYETFRQEVELEAEAVRTVEVIWNRAPEQGTPPPPPPPPPEHVDEGAVSGLVVGGAVLVGVGVVGMGMFAVAGLMADARFDELEEECGGAACPDPSYDERIDEGETMDTVANVGLGIGIAGLVAGGTLILIGALTDGGGSEPEPATGLQLVVTPTGGWVGYRSAL